MSLRVLLLWLTLGAVALAQEPRVRISLPGDGTPWVGQRVPLVIELLAPGYFASSPAFDLPKVPGLLIAPPAGSPTLSSETIGGTTFTVQRHEVSLFPRQGGDQSIPPIAVRFQYKRQPLDKVTLSASVQTKPISFTVKVPLGAEKLGSVLSARGLNVTETWKPLATSATAGDAWTRTIKYTAPEVPAMAFPPFPQSPLKGVAVYPKPPLVLDRVNRGSFTGERQDEFVYVFQEPGRVAIPAVRLTWFNLDTHALERIDVPAHEVDVAPAPAAASANVKVEGDQSGARAALQGLIQAASALLLTLLFWRFRVYWMRLAEPFRPVHLAPLNPPVTDSPLPRPREIGT